jgi:hypothetical protein
MTNGHATAAPPRSVMNSRRLMPTMGTSSPVVWRRRQRAFTTDCFSTRATGLSPSAQLLGLCLLSTLEIIVRLHEKKPSTLAIADRTCLLQVLFRFVPQDIDAHAAIPVTVVGAFRPAIMAKYRTNACPASGARIVRTDWTACKAPKRKRRCRI